MNRCPLVSTFLVALLLVSGSAHADTANLWAIAGDATSAITVGTNGRVLFASGGHATFLPSQTPAITSNLLGCAPSGEGTYFIVGEDGTILKSSAAHGSAFIQETSGTAVGLNAVAAFQTRMLAVGNGGVLVRSASLLGGGWTNVSSPTTATLRGLARNTSIGVVVGDDGTIMKGNAFGSEWSVVAGVPAENDTLHGVAVLTDGRFIAVGTGGTVLRGLASGEGWTAMSFPEDVDLYGVAVRPGASQLVVAVGAAGSIFTSTNAGATWSPADSGVMRDLHSVAYTEVDFLIAGDHGTMLRSIDGTLWLDQTPPARKSWGQLRNRFRRQD